MLSHEEKEQGARRFYFKAWEQCNPSERSTIVSRLRAELNSILPMPKPSVEVTLQTEHRKDLFMRELAQKKADEEQRWKAILDKHETQREQKIRDAELMRLYQTDKIAWAKAKREDWLKNNPTFENSGKAE